MTVAERLVFDVHDGEWITDNGRYHWADKARRTKTLRTRAAAAARGLTAPDPCLVIAEIGYPRGGRADPANAAPTIKALIDGCVDAGLWPDDDHTHIVGPTPTRGPTTRRRGIHVVTLRLIPQEVPL